jgi:hypothetical protein
VEKTYVDRVHIVAYWWFYSDGFFISAQKFNKPQLNAISSSPNTTGQHLSFHPSY